MNDRKFGLVGHPLGHSYSPRIHELLGSTPYDLIDIAEDELEALFARRAFDGVNVTIPYKVAALSLVDDASEAARAIGCVNTVVKRPDGTLFGHNTDYDGFAYLIDSLGADIDGRTAAVFGNGGATRAVLAVLRDKGAARIIVFDRKAEGKGEPRKGMEERARSACGDTTRSLTPMRPIWSSRRRRSACIPPARLRSAISNPSPHAARAVQVPRTA